MAGAWRNEWRNWRRVNRASTIRKTQDSPLKTKGRAPEKSKSRSLGGPRSGLARDDGAYYEGKKDPGEILRLRVPTEIARTRFPETKARDAALRMTMELGLEAAAATAAKAASDAAHNAKARGGRIAGASGCGSHDLAGPRGHLVEAIHKTDGMKDRSAGGLIPGGLLQHAVECADPFFLDAKRHGEGQVLFEICRRLWRARQVVGFNVAQKVLESQRVMKGADTVRGPSRHEPSESGDDDTGENGGDSKRLALDSGMLREVLAEEMEHGCYDARSE
jgi:hypothetical protein